MEGLAGNLVFYRFVIVVVLAIAGVLSMFFWLSLV